MDNTALFKIGYGLYVLTAREGDKDNGCIVNAVAQVADNPVRIMLSVNKANLTHDMILRTGRFNLNVLSEEAPFKVFQHFGFQSGRNVNKFENCEVEMRGDNGLLYLPKYINSYIGCELRHAVDLKSHTLFIAEMTEGKAFSDIPSMTYAYYHANVKPKLAAPKGKWVCKICGYVYEGDEVPDDFICPICKHGKADFEKVQ
jgi:flavin reductase (DIM6/NTAB) family NADH-FMN oxidoreductase RutF